MRERLLKMFPAHSPLVLPPSAKCEAGVLNWRQGALLFVGMIALTILALYLNSFSTVP